jgi:hypothetical protein
MTASAVSNGNRGNGRAVVREGADRCVWGLTVPALGGLGEGENARNRPDVYAGVVRSGENEI